MKRLSAFHYHRTSGKFKGVHRFVFFILYLREANFKLYRSRKVCVSIETYILYHSYACLLCCGVAVANDPFRIFNLFVVKRRATEITNQFFDSHLKNQFQTSDFR